MKKPNSRTVIAFLKSKNWKEEQRDDLYCILKPPAEIKFENPFRYKIPIKENAIDYKEYMTRLIFGIVI